MALAQLEELLAITGLPVEIAQLLADPEHRAALGKFRLPRRDPDIDKLVDLASTVFAAPVTLVSLADMESRWETSRTGVDDPTDMRVHAMLTALAVVAPDGVFASADARTEPGLAAVAMAGTGFCAAAALTFDGARVGALCVVASEPRPPDAFRLDRLANFAALASSLLALKDSEQRGSVAALALTRVEKRHQLALEAATIASWMWDVKTDMVECDPLLPQLFNLRPGTRLRARKLFFAIDRRDLRQTTRELDAALATGADYSGEYRIRGTSPPRWVSTRGRVIERDGEGKPSLVIGVSYDVTRRRSTEESQHTLLRELNHRVKNTLATVQALASQTARHTRQPEEFVEAFSARLQSLGRAHGLLSDHEWRGISLRDLVRLQTLPFDDVRSSRFNVVGPMVWLTPDQALALGVMLHELASNAARHGALSVPGGAVDISAAMDGQNDMQRIVLVWQERGGPVVAAPGRVGFGSLLIRRSLDKLLKSSVKHEFRPDGVRVEVTLPFEASAL